MEKIKFLLFDVDGTLTDGKVYISASGDEMKGFNVKDGYAIINVLPKLDITPVIVTGRKSKLVEIRAKELGIELLYQGIADKCEILNLLMEQYHVTEQSFGFLGDDFQDIHIMKRCGFAACPADATDEVKKHCNIVLSKKGGEGAAQELILYLYNRRKSEDFKG